MLLPEKSAAFLGVSGELRLTPHTAGARTGLPKNPACLLITVAALPEGDLRGKPATGRRSEREQPVQ
jgi:hypothetical protein